MFWDRFLIWCPEKNTRSVRHHGYSEYNILGARDNVRDGWTADSPVPAHTG